MRTSWLGMLCIGAAALCGCAPATSTLSFEHPEGSTIVLEGEPGGVLIGGGSPTQEVAIPDRVELPQFADIGADSGARRFTGYLRIDGCRFRRPEGARRYIKEENGAEFIAVKGFYWVYAYDATSVDQLATIKVDFAQPRPTVDKPPYWSLETLLSGGAVTLTGNSPSGQQTYKFQLGIDLPE